MAKMIHSMIRVMNAEKSTQFYQDILNLEVKRSLNFKGFDLHYLGNDESDFELELTVNHDKTQPYILGDGYGHLAFSAQNIESLHQRAAQLGYRPRPVKSFYNDDELVAKFFFITDPDGYEIEIIERSEQYH